MNYKLLGRSGLRVSELSLGTMTFGEEISWGASKEESHRIFDKYVEVGGNFFDTADGYTNGSSERILGEFIKGQRERFVIATKYSFNQRPGDPNGGGNHRKNLVQALDCSPEAPLHGLYRPLLGARVGSSDSGGRNDARAR